MAEGGSGMSSNEIQYESNNMNPTIQVTMKYILEKFKGTESIFSLKARYGRAGAKINPSLVQKGVVLLRLQYLNLFVKHFPTGAQYQSYRNLSLYTEFAKEMSNLREQVDSNKTTKYFLTIKHLIHLSEVMASGLMEFQILWYNCWLCGVPRPNNATVAHPVVNCLARTHNVPSNVVAKIVGFPIKCTCNPRMYHCAVFESDSSSE